MTKVSIMTLGCPKNIVDSDNLSKGLTMAGLCLTQDMNDSDILLVNTCGFIEDAKKESIEEILKLKDLRERGKKLLVFGCLAKRYKDDLIHEIPEIDAIWGVGEEDRIIEYCRGIKGAEGRRRNQEPGVRGQDSAKGIEEYDSPSELLSYAYIKISEGCDRGCTFCVIPSIRGRYRSFDSESILRSAEEHVLKGFRELVIIAQDIGSYSDKRGYGLPSLLSEIASIEGDFRIRLLYLYPTEISVDLLSVIAGNEKICRYIDMPFQHSEDRILRAMGRKGTRDSYRKIIDMIRDMMPDITLRTTFITGFPGETEDDFEGLCRFIEELRFDRLGVFEYSKEEGTPASKMKESVDKRVARKRRNELMRIQSHISAEKNRSLIGKRFRALVDETDSSAVIARLCSQAPEIDGVVIIEKGKGNAETETNRLKTGDFADVEITGAYDYDLKARVV